MDSGNSGSLQSSSGGDEEYDSRSDSISAFINPSATHFGSISSRQQPQLDASQTTMFDPSPSYFDHMSRPPQNLQNPSSPLLNFDVGWPKTFRSDSSRSEINPLVASSSSLQPFLGSQNQPRSHFSNADIAVSFTSEAEKSGVNPANASMVTPRASSSLTDQAHVARNPKKRSRASRRAPTTVLTTDTTNFRAMVQEFTGIPAPPFTSPSFPRSRFDLFGTPSTMTMRSNPLDNSLQPPYLRRPFPQKVQLPPPFLSSLSSSTLSSSVVDALGTNNNNNNNINITSGNSTSPFTSNVDYQLASSELGLSKQPMQSMNLFNMHNPILTSLLQSNSSSMGSKTQGSMQIPSNDSQLKMSFMDELGGHGHVNVTLSGLPNLVSSDHVAPRNENNPMSWGNGGGSDEGGQSQVRSFIGNYDFSRNAANGKVNQSASSSNFHGDKGMGIDNIAARNEGMVETWICSSD